jgi:hypothetical protein
MRPRDTPRPVDWQADFGAKMGAWTTESAQKTTFETSMSHREKPKSKEGAAQVWRDLRLALKIMILKSRRVGVFWAKSQSALPIWLLGGVGALIVGLSLLWGDAADRWGACGFVALNAMIVVPYVWFASRGEAQSEEKIAIDVETTQLVLTLMERAELAEAAIGSMRAQKTGSDRQAATRSIARRL